MKPEIVPHKGPNKGDVKPESRLLDNVIRADVPKTG